MVFFSRLRCQWIHFFLMIALAIAPNVQAQSVSTNTSFPASPPYLAPTNNSTSSEAPPTIFTFPVIVSIIFAFISGTAVIIGTGFMIYNAVTRSACPLKYTSDKAVMRSVAETWLFEDIKSTQKPNLEHILREIFQKIDTIRILIYPRKFLGFFKRKSVAGLVLEETLAEGAGRVEIHLLHYRKYNWRGHRIHDGASMTSIEAHSLAMAAAKGDLSNYNQIQLTRSNLASYQRQVGSLYPYMQTFLRAASTEWTAYLSNDYRQFFIRLGQKHMGILFYAIQTVQDEEMQPAMPPLLPSFFEHIPIPPMPPPLVSPWQAITLPTALWQNWPQQQRF